MRTLAHSDSRPRSLGYLNQALKNLSVFFRGVKVFAIESMQLFCTMVLGVNLKYQYHLGFFWLLFASFWKDTTSYWYMTYQEIIKWPVIENQL